jgi:CubicO group peptidase (beta-lactamase class C family)
MQALHDFFPFIEGFNTLGRVSDFLFHRHHEARHEPIIFFRVSLRWAYAAWMILWLAPDRSAADVAPSPKYAPVLRKLTPFIEKQVAEKRLPALSIALVDDQEIVWTRGFGFANPQEKTPATADTVYRVGSVSKLFTDLAVMQLVEQGKLDLDAPESRGGQLGHPPGK